MLPAVQPRSEMSDHGPTARRSYHTKSPRKLNIFSLTLSTRFILLKRKEKIAGEVFFENSNLTENRDLKLDLDLKSDQEVLDQK